MTNIEQLYSKYHSMVFHIAMAVLKSKAEADDVVQDIFAFKLPKVLDKSPDLKDKEYGRMLTAIAKNAAIDQYRKNKRFTSLDDKLIQIEYPNTHDDLYLIIDKLDEHEKILVTWKYIWNLTWEELAKKTNSSIGGSRKKVSKICKKLFLLYGGTDNETKR